MNDDELKNLIIVTENNNRTITVQQLSKMLILLHTLGMNNLFYSVLSLYCYFQYISSQINLKPKEGYTVYFYEL